MRSGGFDSPGAVGRPERKIFIYFYFILLINEQHIELLFIKRLKF